MNRLLWKIFIPVILAMASMVLISTLLVIGFTVRVAQDTNHNVPQLYEEAKDVLLEQGEAGLKEWLNDNKESLLGARIFIVDADNQDLLMRIVPPREQMIPGLNRRVRSHLRTDDRAERHFTRRTGRYPYLVASSGERYRFSLARPAGGFIGLLRSQEIIWPVLLVMILTSVLVSALIASRISKPVQRLRQGAQRFAQGHLSERVAPDFVKRKDEIGALARDFDVMAERISGLMGNQQRLLRDVSHELRSPLARLTVALGLAEQRGDDAVKPELKRIETEANLLNEMIGKILSLVRLNNLSIDNSSLQWENMDLVITLRNLILNANYEGQEKSVSVDLQAPESVNIKAVPHLLTSALENILRNAVKYSEPNSQIKCELKIDSGKILLSVSNKGIGVDAEDLEKIFEPFYRASEVREHQQGTGGIGLAIAKGAVKLHGGSIRAENIEGGFRVVIEL